MIVIDASALLEALLRTPVGIAVRQRLLSGAEVLHAPHLIDLEIASTLRRYASARVLDVERCRQALIDMGGFRLYRHPHNHLLTRVWQLRHNLSTYDAAYVTVAEMLAAPLLTHDPTNCRLGRASRADRTRVSWPGRQHGYGETPWISPMRRNMPRSAASSAPGSTPT